MIMNKKQCERVENETPDLARKGKWKTKPDVSDSEAIAMLADDLSS